MNKRNPNNSRPNPELVFPLSMHLKAIMENTCPPEQNRKALKDVLDRLSIPHGDWSDKTSKEKKYISITVEVTLSDRELMFFLYEELRNVPGLRMAI